MKKSALAAIALFALTGAAFAENPSVGGQKEQAPVAVDLITTQSVHGSSSTESSKPRLGYEVSPWFNLK